MQTEELERHFNTNGEIITLLREKRTNNFQVKVQDDSGYVFHHFTAEEKAREKYKELKK